MQHKTEFSALPKDVLLHTIRYLPFSNAKLNQKLTCKLFHSVNKHPEVWTLHINQFFRKHIINKYLKDGQSGSETLFLHILRSEIQLQKNECIQMLNIVNKNLPHEKQIVMSVITPPFEKSTFKLISKLLVMRPLVMKSIKGDLNHAMKQIENIQYITEAISCYEEINNLLDGINNFLITQTLERCSLNGPTVQLNLNGLLTRLPEEAIDALCQAKITHLRMAGCDITWLPEKIADVDTLKELYLNFNKLTDLPSSMGGLTKLKVINIMNNKLCGVPDVIWELTGLETLAMGNFKPSLTTCICCESFGLKATGNAIKSLPSDIGKLVNLKHLALPSVQLNNIDPCITGLKHLKFLNLCYNNLQTLPLCPVGDEDTELPNLKKYSVWLLNNPIALDRKSLWFDLSKAVNTIFNDYALPIESQFYQALTNSINIVWNTYVYAKKDPLPFAFCITAIITEQAIKYMSYNPNGENEPEPKINIGFSLQ